MNNDINAKIRQFIEPQVNGQPLEDKADIFQLGYVSSLFAMQLVGFIEKEFSIQVDNEDLNIENFNCIEHLSAFVTRKLEKIAKRYT